MGHELYNDLENKDRNILPDIWFSQALEQIGEDRTECAS